MIRTSVGHWIEQKGGRAHRPAAHLTRVAGATRDDALVHFAELFLCPRLKDGIGQVRDTESARFAAARGLIGVRRVLRNMMRAARRQLKVRSARDPSDIRSGTKIWRSRKSQCWLREGGRKHRGQHE